MTKTPKIKQMRKTTQQCERYRRPIPKAEDIRPKPETLKDTFFEVKAIKDAGL
jgi:hypothetical protein